jgi:asparagine synthase (glutamine-hydrolysing)
MCGVVGFLQRGSRSCGDRDTLLQMMRQVHHRGPDGEGEWISGSGEMSLGHTRLSIQDLSKHGAQPMRSATGRFVISFNGEVYNFPSLKKQLEQLGHKFRGHSDTEVMLASIEQWGLEAAVSRFIGMFAFALWDKDQQSLSLVRDRIGIKPLYYRETATSLVFASELKALREYDSARLAIDRNVLASFFRYSYVPAPYTIYEGVNKLQPGTILTARFDASGNLETKVDTYWQLRDFAANGTPRFEGEYDEALDQLQDLLGRAVSQRMVSDVPLGAFLSGGIDSSIVVSLMQQASTSPVKTFTIGFLEDGFNEAQWAKKVAEHLRTDHTEIYVSSEDACSVIPDLPTIYDEPFADSSQIPTVLVSRLARQDVTVCLSGDGGDELFSGYKRYDLGASVWRGIGWMPASVRSGFSRLLSELSGQRSNALEFALDPLFRRFGGASNVPDKLQKVAALMRSSSREHAYHHIVSHWKDSLALVKGATNEPRTMLGDPPPWLRGLPLFDFMMAVDACTYLPDDILVKIDRASMSCGLEARVPILDHRVAEFAFGLPLAFKRKGGQQKLILRDLLSRFVPLELIDRPKMGFGVPIDKWLRGPLREWAADLLSSERLRGDGYLNPEPVLQKWKEHQSGERNWSAYLWDVLMFQAWLDANR